MVEPALAEGLVNTSFTEAEIGTQTFEAWQAAWPLSTCEAATLWVHSSRPLTKLTVHSASAPGPLAEDREAPADRPDVVPTLRGVVREAVTIIAVTETAHR